MMRLPGTVSRPAETMVRQMDLISADNKCKLGIAVQPDQ